MKHALLLLLLLTTAAPGYANDQEDSGDRPRHGKPPAEAFEVCSASEEGEQCAFDLKDRGSITGQCRIPPRLDDLVCVPDSHKRQPR